MRAIMTYPLCFPCLRSQHTKRRRVPIAVAAAAFPPPAPEPAEPRRLWPHHHADAVARGEALVKWLDAWAQIDEKAARAWMSAPQPHVMPAIDEEPERGPGRRRAWVVDEEPPFSKIPRG